MRHCGSLNISKLYKSQYGAYHNASNALNFDWKKKKKKSSLCSTVFSFLFLFDLVFLEKLLKGCQFILLFGVVLI